MEIVEKKAEDTFDNTPSNQEVSYHLEIQLDDQVSISTYAINLNIKPEEATVTKIELSSKSELGTQTSQKEDNSSIEI